MEAKELKRLDRANQPVWQQLKTLMESLGLKCYGITHGEIIAEYQAYYDGRPQERISSFETGLQSEKCKLSDYFISIAFPYAHALTWSNDADFSVYVRGADYHQVVGSYLERICEFIKGLGYEAKSYTDSNELPERLIAALAGVGFLGRNSTLITQEFGSYVFLGEIQTNLPLPVNEEFTSPGDFELCGICENCIMACPVSVLGTDYVDAPHCLSAVTQQKDLTREELLLLDGRLFGCDTCQRVCPYNRDKAHLGLEDFKPFPYMVTPDLQELLVMSKSQFKDRYAITSAGWRGKAVLSRNALAAMAKRGHLPKTIKTGSPLVSAAYDKLKANRLDPEEI